MLAVLSQWVKGVHDGATFSSRTGALMRMTPAFRRRTHEPRDSSIADGGVMMPSAAMRGVDEDELAYFARFGAERGIEVRFIEFMPFRSNGWVERRLVPCSELMTRLGEGFGLTELA